MRPLINIQQMAVLLGLPISWIYRKTCQGKMPHYKIGKYLRFDPDEVMAFIKNMKIG